MTRSLRALCADEGSMRWRRKERGRADWYMWVTDECNGLRRPLFRTMVGPGELWAERLGNVGHSDTHNPNALSLSPG